MRQVKYRTLKVASYIDTNNIQQQHRGKQKWIEPIKTCSSSLLERGTIEVPQKWVESTHLSRLRAALSSAVLVDGT